MVEPVDTTIPPERQHHPPEWHAMWVHACIEMAPYGRRPGKHLIDELITNPSRAWLANRCAELAAVTVSSGGMLQPNGRLKWKTMLQHPATMRPVQVVVVLDVDEIQIVTAYPP